ncbi:MAG: reverse transcriptase family protein [Planctomycetaceae bacterium]
MGLFGFLRRLFFPSKQSSEALRSQSARLKRRRKPVRLVPLRRDAECALGRGLDKSRKSQSIQSPETPYRFARFGIESGGFLDLSRDLDEERLQHFGLPIFSTPDELADWLEMPVGKVAWLVHRFTHAHRPDNAQEAHYHHHWMRKRRGGYRLIESPKKILKAVQSRILHEILDHISAHPSAHGFVAGRSIVTNARPHVGQHVLLKCDLENFYPSLRFARVVAIFRSVGYSREAAIWLARLTTSALPGNIPFPGGDPSAILPYLRRHLPQGAPTSPALANLSAYSLDVRLSGMARAFGAAYTRYADDLTFSGPEPFVGSLRTFIPLVRKIIRSERFRANTAKRKVIRANQRQMVAGVVVNERTNVSRCDYDRLKAILHNCMRHGPASQNRDKREDFASHLRGRIAHVAQLNSERGSKLLGIYQQVNW